MGSVSGSFLGRRLFFFFSFFFLFCFFSLLFLRFDASYCFYTFERWVVVCALFGWPAQCCCVWHWERGKGL